MPFAVGSRTVSRGHETEWEDLWRRLAAIAATCPGFRGARLLRSSEHSGKFTEIVEWTSPAAWEAFYERPDVQELTHQTFGLLRAAPVQEWHDTVMEVGPAPAAHP